MAGIFILKTDSALAQQPLVIINEICWMGTVNSANDEWLELYNPGSQDILLDNWKIVSEDGSPIIELKGIIKAKSFYLLERSDETTLEAIAANLIYKGALNNKGENIFLKNGGGEIVDQADFSLGWTVGDNKTKQTAERTENLSWQTSEFPGGTPKEKNSQPQAKKTPAEEKPSKPVSSNLPSTTKEAAWEKSFPENRGRSHKIVFLAIIASLSFSGLTIWWRRALGLPKK